MDLTHPPKPTNLIQKSFDWSVAVSDIQNSILTRCFIKTWFQPTWPILPPKAHRSLPFEEFLGQISLDTTIFLPDSHEFHLHVLLPDFDRYRLPFDEDPTNLTRLLHQSTASLENLHPIWTSRLWVGHKPDLDWP